MIRQVVIDEFYEKQPKRLFEKELRKYEFLTIKFRKNNCKNRVEPREILLDKGVFEKEKNLTPVWFDFDEFLKKNEIKGDKYVVSLKKGKGFDFEEYKIDVREDGATITAGDIEGIRRAVLRFEDLLVAGAGSLKKGETKEKTVIKRRISRGFFTPINRPPKGADEFGDNTDYYPDAYLNRMMHHGVNAIWAYADFDNLVESSYIKEYGQGREFRLKKLNKLIARCKKYGIEVFVFMIAPISLNEAYTVRKYGDLRSKYPEVLGNSTVGPTAFCVYTEFGANYVKEASESLMRAAPGLGGIMSITFGERVTSCGNSWPTYKGEWHNNCPHCHDKTRFDSVTRTVALMKEGMDKVDTKFNFISWTYGMRDATDEMRDEYFQKISPNAISMVNFEDDARVYQLGKKRFAFDYYLCYAGPSRMYKYCAEAAKKYGKELYAKMQICNSHELASVPYIPVPGLVYDKMTGAKDIGVTGVMECWFFGSYPCMMSKAVGMLSGEYAYDSKQSFLFDLAEIYWAKEDVPHAVSAWEYFEKAYLAYPVNVMFNYYGPMHDGIVWDLQLKPKNFGLPRTWQLIDKTDGDRIGECLFYGHTIDEAISLAEEICFNWQKGCDQLAQTTEWENDKNEQITVAKALNLLFNSGLNILKFYRHRQNLGYGRADAKYTFNEMKKIVKQEIANSTAMIPLCLADNRLGWHSEAEGYKFHPAKLRARIKKLKELLKTEFVEVEQRIKDGLCPLEYYQGVDEGVVRAKAGRNGIESAEWVEFTKPDKDSNCQFRIAEDGDDIVVEVKADKKDNFFVTFETELMFPQNTYVFEKDGNICLWRDGASHQSINDEKHEQFSKYWQGEDLSSDENTTYVRGRVSKKDIDFKGFPFRLSVKFFTGAKWTADIKGCGTGTLGRNHTSPGEFGWID